MQPQELARAFYQAVRQTGRRPNEADLRAAHGLIECYGFAEAVRMIPDVRRRIAAASEPTPDLADAVAYFAQEAAAVADAAAARESSEREWQERREKEDRARAEERRFMPAFEALPRPTQRRLIQEVKNASPPAPEAFFRRLAALRAGIADGQAS